VSSVSSTRGARSAPHIGSSRHSKISLDLFPGNEISFFSSEGEFGSIKSILCIGKETFEDSGIDDDSHGATTPGQINRLTCARGIVDHPREVLPRLTDRHLRYVRIVQSPAENKSTAQTMWILFPRKHINVPG